MTLPGVSARRAAPLDRARRRRQHGRMLEWIIEHPNAATALATMALVAVGLLIGSGQIAVIWVGIRAMDRSTAMRNADRAAALEEMRKRYEAEERRHKKAMVALRAPIERTGPRPAPAE